MEEDWEITILLLEFFCGKSPSLVFCYVARCFNLARLPLLYKLDRRGVITTIMKPNQDYSIPYRKWFLLFHFIFIFSNLQGKYLFITTLL